MNIAENVYRAWSSWQRRQPGHEIEWKKAHPAEWNQVLWVMEARKQHG